MSKSKKTFYYKGVSSYYTYYTFTTTAYDYDRRGRKECESTREEFVEELVKKHKPPKGFVFVQEQRQYASYAYVMVYKFPLSMTEDINRIKKVAEEYGRVYINKELYRKLEMSIFKQPIIDDEFYVESAYEMVSFIYDPKRCAAMLKRRETIKNKKVKTGDVPISLLKPLVKCLENNCKDGDLGQIIKVSGYKNKKKEHWMMEAIALHQATGGFKTQKQLNQDSTYKKIIIELFEFVPSMRSRMSDGGAFRRFSNWVESQYLSQMKAKKKNKAGSFDRVLDF